MKDKYKFLGDWSRVRGLKKKIFNFDEILRKFKFIRKNNRQRINHYLNGCRQETLQIKKHLAIFNNYVNKIEELNNKKEK